MNRSTPKQARQTIAVSPARYRAILGAFEYGSPLSGRQIAEAAGISVSTLTRAARLLCQTGLWTALSGSDSETGRLCRLFAPTADTVLAVPDLTGDGPAVRLLDMTLRPLAATRMMYNPTVSPEENLRLLCARTRTLAMGCRIAAEHRERGTPPSFLPVLLLPDAAEGTAPLVCGRFELLPLHEEALRQGLGRAALAKRTEGEALRSALRYLPEARGVCSLLYLQVGGREALTRLYGREGHPLGCGEWKKAPFGAGLPAMLRQYLSPGGAPTVPHSVAWQEGVERFLEDVGSFLRPECVVIEERGGRSLVVERLSAHLPPDTRVYLHPSRPDVPTLAQTGVARIARRAVWDRRVARLAEAQRAYQNRLAEAAQAEADASEESEEDSI